MSQLYYTEMHLTGEEFDFYVTYPQGLQYGSDPDNFAHNAGACCGDATANDLQFTRDLMIVNYAKNLCVPLSITVPVRKASLKNKKGMRSVILLHSIFFYFAFIVVGADMFIV